MRVSAAATGNWLNIWGKHGYRMPESPNAPTVFPRSGHEHTWHAYASQVQTSGGSDHQPVHHRQRSARYTDKQIDTIIKYSVRSHQPRQHLHQQSLSRKMPTIKTGSPATRAMVCASTSCALQRLGLPNNFEWKLLALPEVGKTICLQNAALPALKPGSVDHCGPKNRRPWCRLAATQRFSIFKLTMYADA